MRRWRISFFLIIALFGTVALLQRPCVQWMVERGIRRSIEFAVGGPVRVESVAHRKGELEFINLSAAASVDQGHSGLGFSVQRLYVSYQVDWLRWALDVKVLLEGPKGTCTLTGSDSLQSLFPENASAGVFSLRGDVEVVDGVLELHRQSTAGESLLRLFVQGKSNLSDSWTAELRASPHADPKVADRIIARLQGSAQETTGELVVQHIHCNEFARLCHFLYGEPLEALSFSEGLLDGRLLLVTGKDGTPALEGDLRFSDVAFEHPVWGVCGEVGLARIRLQDSQLDSAPGEPKVLGQLEILEAGSVTVKADQASTWSLRNLAGGVFLYTDGPSRIKLNGVFATGNEIGQLRIDGEARLLDPIKPYIDVALKLESAGRPTVDVRLVAHQTAPEKKRWEFHCNNFGPSHCDILRSTLRGWVPQIEQARLRDGRLNGSLLIDVAGTTITRAELDNLVAKGVVVDFPDRGVSGRVALTTGQCCVDFDAANPVGTVNADLLVHKGELWPMGSSEQPWKVEEIETQLKVVSGVFHASEVSGLFAGVRGQVTIDWNSSQDVLTYDLEGGGTQFAQWLPQIANDKLTRALGNDSVHLKGGVRRYTEGLMAHGVLSVSAPDRIGESITFGWDVDQVNPELWNTKGDLTGDWKTVGHQLLGELAPQAMRPAACVLSSWLDSEQGFWGFVARRGWFKAELLPLERYVDPIIFDADNSLELSGVGKVEGSFEGYQAALRFAVQNVGLQNAALDIRAAAIGSADDRIAGTALPGRYYLNMKQGIHFGWVPLHGATYHEKTSDIHFQDVDSLVFLGECQAHAIDLTANAEGVYFSGSIDVMGEDVGDDLKVTVVSREISGDLSGVRRLLKRVDNAFIGAFPLEGRASSGNAQGFLEIVRANDSFNIDAYVRGKVSEGALNSPSGLLSLQGVNCDFAYDYASNTIAFQNLQGRALVGDSREGDEYTLASETVRIYGFPDSHLEFDVRVEDALRDYIRIRGEGKSERLPTGEHLVRFAFDPESTHIGVLRPNISSLVVKEWTEVCALRADPLIDLSSVPAEAQRISKTGWFTLNPADLDFLTSLQLNGELRAKVDFDPEEKQYLYTAMGDSVSVRERTFDETFISGRYSQGTLVVDQLQLDELSIAADIAREADHWRLGLLGIRYGNALLAGLKGDYFPERRELIGTLDLFEIDFDASETPRELKALWGHLEPSGEIHSAGSLTVSFADSERWATIAADLKSTTKNFAVAGARFADHQQLRTRFSSVSGFSVDNLQAVVEQEESGQKGLGLAITQLRYLPQQERLELDRAGISLPAENLNWLAERLQKKLPDLVSEEVADVVRHLKPSGNVSAILQVSLAPAERDLRIEFVDDTYHLFGKDHLLKNLFLDFTGYSVKMGTIYQFQERNLGALCSLAGTNVRKGLLAINADGKIPERVDEPGNLLVDWTRDSTNQFAIRKVTGLFSGLQCDLEAEKPEDTPDDARDTIALTGEIGGDFSQASWLCSPAVAASIAQWKISTGLIVGGRFEFSKNSLADLHFDGQISGEDFYLKGFQFDSLFAHVTYTPDIIQALDLRVMDPALGAQIDEVSAELQEDASWQVAVPSILVRDVKPDLLRKSDDPSESANDARRSLLIKSIEIRDLLGNPADATSWKGTFSLAFVNPSVADAPRSILSIPKDLIARIGLSTSVLNPATGTLIADIYGGRVNFTEFRDVFSEGKVSRFFLAADGPPSFMDFDGNLSLRVRMKQYNLLFKFTELFTIAVVGNLAEPRYTLKKQPVAAGESF